MSASLRSKIFLYWLPGIVLAIVLIAGYGTYTAYKRDTASAQARLQSIALFYAANVGTELERAMDAARTLAQMLSAIRASNQRFSRDEANAMLKEILKRNPSFLAVYTAWEPNAFDGNDAAFVGAPGHDSTGRFSPYWSQLNGKIQQAVNIGYDSSGIGDYYQQPKNTQRECILEPYSYPVQGKNVLITSLSVPIIIGEVFYGICAVDITLDFLQTLTDKADVFDHAGSVAILSHIGTIVSMTDRPEYVAKSMGTVFSPFRTDSTASKGAPSRRYQASRSGTFLEHDTLYAFAPMQVGFASTAWSVLVSVPKDVVITPLTAVTFTQAAMVIVIISVLALTIWLFSTRMLQAISALQLATETFATGNLEALVAVTGDDELSVVGESFNKMAHKIRAMMDDLRHNQALTAQTQRDLRISEQRLRMVMELAPFVAVQYYNREGRVQYWNKASEYIFGWTAEETIGKTLDELIHTSEEAKAFVQMLNDIRQTGQSFGPSVNSFQRKDGSAGFCLVTTFVIPASEEGDLTFVCMDVDISEQRRAEEDLRRIQKNQQKILETMGVGVTVTRGNELLFVNEAWCNLTGYTQEELRHFNIYSVIHPDSRKNIEERGRARLRGENLPGRYEERIFHKNGTTLWVEITAFVIDYEDEPAVIASFVDITALKNLILQLETLIAEKEHLLVRLEHQQNAALRSFIQGQEDERHRIAQDLHDGVGHLLSIVKINLSSFHDEVQRLVPNRMQEFEHFLQLYDQAVQEVRAVSHQLMPATLRKMGLKVALQDLMTMLTISTSLRVDSALDALDSLSPHLSTELETSIFRILQELVNNTLKYAHATTMSIQFINSNGALLCIYEDDGIGFDTTAAPNGIGLRNITNRVLLLGGTIEFDSSPGSGLVATMEIPMYSPQNELSSSPQSAMEQAP